VNLEALQGAKAILFDLDGTLISYTLDYASFLDQMLDEAGECDHGAVLAMYRQAIMSEGPVTFGASVRHALNLNGVMVGQDHDARMERCVQGYAAGIGLLPHAVALLEVVSHLPKAIVSNGPSDMQRAALRASGLESFFEVIVVSGDADVAVRKPNPKIFHLACKRLACAPEDAVMVGDNVEADLEGARGAGIRAVHIEELVRDFA
jgi:putative hydrolase of the HAD superfamily